MKLVMERANLLRLCLTLLVSTDALQVGHRESFGPDGCVTVSRTEEGTCMITTECTDEDISKTEFAFLCLTRDHSIQKHTFGWGGFDDEEEFDTMIACEKCSAPRVLHGGAGAHTNKTMTAPETAAVYGPDACVSTFRSPQGTCLVETRCGPHLLDNFTLGLTCIDEHGNASQHFFTPVDEVNAFNGHETFDTQIPCSLCLGIDDPPPLHKKKALAEAKVKRTGDSKANVTEDSKANVTGNSKVNLADVVADVKEIKEEVTELKSDLKEIKETIAAKALLSQQQRRAAKTMAAAPAVQQRAAKVTTVAAAPAVQTAPKVATSDSRDSTEMPMASSEEGEDTEAVDDDREDDSEAEAEEKERIAEEVRVQMQRRSKKKKAAKLRHHRYQQKHDRSAFHRSSIDTFGEDYLRGTDLTVVNLDDY